MLIHAELTVDSEHGLYADTTQAIYHKEPEHLPALVTTERTKNQSPTPPPWIMKGICTSGCILCDGCCCAQALPYILLDCTAFIL